jgi:predicted RNA-binding protein YlqC (UPF0109 family)
MQPSIASALQGCTGQDSVMLYLSVATQMVGLIIGKSGAFFREISHDSKVKLFLQTTQDMPSESRERVLIIVGNRISVISAIRKIYSKIQQANEKSNSKFSKPSSKFSDSNLSPFDNSKGEEMIKWIVPQTRCGSLIGKRGEGIKSINTLSGSWVKVAHVEELSPGTNER